MGEITVFSGDYFLFLAVEVGGKGGDLLGELEGCGWGEFGASDVGSVWVAEVEADYELGAVLGFSKAFREVFECAGADRVRPIL